MIAPEPLQRIAPRTSPGICDVESRFDVLQHDPPRLRRMVVHLPLFRGERMNALSILDSFAAGLIDTE